MRSVFYIPVVALCIGMISCEPGNNLPIRESYVYPPNYVLTAGDTDSVCYCVYNQVISDFGHLDLNADSIPNEASITVSHMSSPGGYNYYATIGADDSISFIRIDTSQVPLFLHAGDTISQGSYTWTNPTDAPFLYFHHHSYTQITNMYYDLPTPWGPPGYVGFRILDSSENRYYYGWLHVKGSGSILVMDLAFMCH